MWCFQRYLDFDTFWPCPWACMHILRCERFTFHNFPLCSLMCIILNGQCTYTFGNWPSRRKKHYRQLQKCTHLSHFLVRNEKKSLHVILKTGKLHVTQSNAILYFEMHVNCVLLVWSLRVLFLSEIGRIIICRDGIPFAQNSQKQTKVRQVIE